MDIFNIFEAVQKTLHDLPNDAEELEPYIYDADGGVVEVWTPNDTDCVLHVVTNLLLKERCTIIIAKLFAPILLELLSRCEGDSTHEGRLARHGDICKMIGKLVWIFPDVKRFCYQYFETSQQHILAEFLETSHDPPRKKFKLTAEFKSDNLSLLLVASIQLLAFDLDYFKRRWNWSILTDFMKLKDTQVKWLSYLCMFRLANIPTYIQNSVLESEISKEDLLMLNTRYTSIICKISSYFSTSLSEDINENTLLMSDSNLSNNVVNVEGILLNKKDDSIKVAGFTPLVLVNSTKTSLRELALAVSSGLPVLLQGPVGCGKTSLVEHLAVATGRDIHTDLVKIQFGEHIDNKTLLGTYCCTESPGEFIWKAGILTQAIINGSWLLLEDIDLASSDVITTLAPLFENHTILLPGQADPVKAHSGFQLFVTQRLLVGHDRSFVEFRNNAEQLKRFWTKITMQNLTNEELINIIKEKWSVLGSIVDRILRIYYQFCTDLEGEDQYRDAKLSIPASVYRNRLISTRDLFKFCRRIAKDFDIKSGELSAVILQHALDCFCNSFPNMANRVAAAEHIGVKFNIPSSKACFYCVTYKPNVEVYNEQVQIGRACLPIKPETVSLMSPPHVTFAYTRQALSLLEKVSVAAASKEPVLLVGETGTGKTSIVQFLASQTNSNLTVINMSQQSDSVDLLGGYKPIDLRLIVSPLRDEFNVLFPQSFSLQHNTKFLGHITKCFLSKRWEELFEMMLHIQKSAIQRFKKNAKTCPDSKILLKKWSRFGAKITQLKMQVELTKVPLAFAFIEGALVKAMKNGNWILLDEMNLAESNTLQCLSSVLESDADSIILLDRGDKTPISRHPDFRVFACMNPATDVGKKELTAGIRNRFTEFYVEELEDKHDLMILVESYLVGLSVQKSVLECIVNFYLFIRKVAESLNDGTGHRPHYSLRTLCRALKCASSNQCGSLFRSLYEGFALSFLSQVDQESYAVVQKLITEFILGRNRIPILKEKIPEPSGKNYMGVQGYWITVGNITPYVPKDYILTPSVQQNLQNLARIVSLGNYPVLLQGETSVGKTSLIQFLASITGNHCVRVNNHEHTDIEEYVGSYCADHNGKLIYKEGILVEAMKRGYWIILDELNLAPTEVMEALNRVLDDNRELFITETHQLIKAHPKFRVFATQNPPGSYGGRKVLSRAFRNRFIELYFGDIPTAELEIILEKRCAVPPSYSKKMVSIMKDLQLHRRESGIFFGKQGFITFRDLFRWGERYRLSTEGKNTLYDWTQHIADEGYMLLAGRVRHPEEAQVIQKIIYKHFRREVNPDVLFDFTKGSSTTSDVMKYINNPMVNDDFNHIVYTPNMSRLAILVGKALTFGEPVLLVGNTGCGKTTMCQIFSQFSKSNIHMVNCHMHTESADFLGSLRPVRSHTDEDSQKLFEWVDGPLVTAMENGDFFLADEISLADDSVLERLNSVLEPQRELRLTEKCSDEVDENTVIVAHKDFRMLATMNPGGDYGKKELSPALRNRFTEIWCPSEVTTDDILKIVDANIKPRVVLSAIHGNSGFGPAIVEFINWLHDSGIGKKSAVSIRDIMSWVNFINETVTNRSNECRISPCEAYVHGACLTFLDSLGTGVGNPESLHKIRSMSYKFLEQQIDRFLPSKEAHTLKRNLNSNWESYKFSVKVTDNQSLVGFGPFCIPSTTPDRITPPVKYNVDANGSRGNAVRIARAMQLWKPILLEGSPGVGKTSLVSTLAKAAGYDLVRINLSEQTDISDLFGTDLPTGTGEAGEFLWRDGPLLEGLKNGSWILLDELNLASQSVLEGLNACLDHRAEIFIPELGKSFSIANHSTRIFACQNPFKQGNSRKGLPKSFLNRFTQVYLEQLSPWDMKQIVARMFPAIPPHIVSDMVDFNEKVIEEIKEGNLCQGEGHLMTYNLRDIFRWCDVILTDQLHDRLDPIMYANIIYADRMRNSSDKKKVIDLCEAHFGSKSFYDEPRKICNSLSRQILLTVFDTHTQVGRSFLRRKGNGTLSGQMIYPMHHQLPALESLVKCMEMKWLTILVGPAACGKTSMVKFLANVTGHTLKVLSVNTEMDTTELLGSFEQADLNRSIDDVVRDIEPVLQRVYNICIRDREQFPRLSSILTIYNRLHRIKRNLSNSVTEEASICEKKIKLISNLLTMLVELSKLTNSHSVLVDLQTQVSEITELIGLSVSTSTGGRFEWVDSLLVQCVQKGYWLVIEDANLCSPSVLDRINSLLENDGCLNIAEQGCILVNGQFKSRTIYPHPDFRIIFTMNPLNGEISTAMRNRGVEIAMTNEIINANRNDNLWDLYAIINSKQVQDPRTMSYIFFLFKLLCNENLVEKPSFYDFLNAVEKCAQFLQKGLKLREALLKSYELAFTKNILDINCRQKSFAHIKEYIDSKEFGPYSEPQRYNELYPVEIPSGVDYQHSYGTSNFRQHNFLFMCMMRRFVDSVLKNFDQSPFLINGPTYTLPPVTSTKEWIEIFSLILKIFFESCSMKQGQLFSLWFKRTLSHTLDCIPEYQVNEIREIENVFIPVQNLIDNHLLPFLNSSVAIDLINKMEVMILDPMRGTYFLELDDVPIDPRWNQYLFYKMLHYNHALHIKAECDGTYNVDAVSQGLHSDANRFLLMFNLSLFHYLEMNAICENKTGNRKPSLYDLADGYDKGGTSAESLPHPVIAYIPRFVLLIYAVLKCELESSKVDYSDEIFWQVWNVIKTYRQFLKFCKSPMNDVPFEDHMNNFSLQSKKMIKSLTYMKQTLFSFEGSSSYSEEMDTVIQNVSHGLGFQDMSKQKVRMKIIKTFSYPSAFRSEMVAREFVDIMEIYETFNIFKFLFYSPNRDFSIDDLKVIITNSFKWSQTLVKAAFSCLGHDDDNRHPIFIRAVHILKLQLRDLGFIDGDDDDIVEVCQQPVASSNMKECQVAHHVELLPLWEYMFLHAEAVFICSMSGVVKNRLTPHHSPPPRLSDKFIIDIGIGELGYDPIHIGQLICLHSSEKKNLYSTCLASFFHFLHNGPLSGNQKICFEWNKKKKKAPSFTKTKSCWEKQSPLLTITCLEIFGSVNDPTSPGLPLKNFGEKQQQIEKVKSILWKSRESLGKENFWHNLATIISLWFDDLVAAMSTFTDINIDANLSDQLEQLWMNLNLSELFTYDNVNILVDTRDCILSMGTLLNRENHDPLDLNWAIGLSYAKVGLLSLVLFAPLYGYDPVQKHQWDYNYCSSQFQDCYVEFLFRDWQNKAEGGISIQDIQNGMHPYVAGFWSLLTKLRPKNDNMRKNLSFRPSPSQFAHLIGDIQQYLSQVGSAFAANKVLNLLKIQKERICRADFCDDEIQKTILNLNTHIGNISSFVKTIKAKYPFYQDLLYPFITGIEMLLLGYHMMGRYISCMLLRAAKPSLRFIESLVSKMFSFPCLRERNIVFTPLQLASFLSSDETIDSFLCLKSLMEVNGKDNSVFNMLKSALLEIINEVTIMKEESSFHVMDVADPIFKRFYDSLAKQDEELAMKKMAEESLYEQKHVGELTDEERAQRDIKAFFPSYDEEYKDFKPISLDDSDERLSEVPEVELILSNNDVLDFWSYHLNLVSKITEIEDPDSPIYKLYSEPDYVTPYLLRHDILKFLLPCLNNIDSTIDTHLIGGHLLAASALQLDKDIINSSTIIKEDQYYNIYHDPNPNEVLQVIPLLESLAARINALLKEFPDNPLLILPLNVVNRILNFSVTSPIMKFITGLELVVDSAQAWEQNAHKVVSLQAELDSVHQKIVYWRKLEHKCWSQCLNTVTKKQYAETAKWWFRIYGLVFNSTEENMNTILSSIQQFIEDSTLGQFAPRMELLHTFYKHLSLIKERQKSLGKIKDVLFNVHAFYNQFLPKIKDKIVEIRKPIEKEVKEFVKICRWNDSNFFSLKKSVEKAHRTLHNSMHKFEVELGQSARKYFQVFSNIELQESSPDCSFSPTRFYVSSAVPLVKSDRDILDILPGYEIFDSISTYIRKSKKLCKKTVKDYPFSKHFVTMNTFTGDVTEKLDHIQSLDVKKTGDKKAEMKEYRHNMQMKKRILSDLLKDLKQSGLSYRKGLIYCDNMESADKQNSMLVSCVSDDVWKHFDSLSKSSCENSTIDAWKNANSYYYKAIAQFAQLDTSIKSPNKLFKDNMMLQKFKGFAGHALEISVSHRQQLVNEAVSATEFCEAVNSFVNVITSHAQKKNFEFKSCESLHYPSQSSALTWKCELSDFLMKASSAFHQFEILLKCCPKTVIAASLQPRPSSGFACCVKNDEIWANLTSEVHFCISQINSIIASSKPVFESKSKMLTWSDISILLLNFRELDTLVSNFTHAHCVHSGSAPYHDNNFTSFLHNLSMSITEKCIQFHEEFSAGIAKDASPGHSKDEVIAKSSKQLLMKVLKAVESVFTLCEVESSDVTKSDDCDINLKLFPDKFAGNFVKLSTCLNVCHCLKHIEKVVKYLCMFENSPQTDAYFERYVLSTVPILQQYSQLLKLNLVTLMEAHRSSSRFLCALLEIFLEFSHKGFGNPPEEADSSESGGTQFRNIEQGGLGEGEGVKDISKDIESEDQLDEAMLEGAEKSQNDSADIEEEEDGIEMSEDFDGKIHDPKAGDEKDGDKDEEEEEEDEPDESELDKKMGDVENADADKLDEQIWKDSDEEEEEDEDLGEDDSGKGVTQNQTSELVAKDNKEKDSDKNNKGSDKCPDLKNEGEYDGEHEDPLIDAPPLLEPEVLDLPLELQIDSDEEDELKGEDSNDMEIDDVKDIDDEKDETVDISDIPEEQKRDERAAEEEEFSNQAEMDMEKGIEEALPEEIMEEEDDIIEEDEEQDIRELSSSKETSQMDADKAQSSDKSKGDTGDVDEAMEGVEEWEGGGHDKDDHHREGQAGYDQLQSLDGGHKGIKVSSKISETEDNAKQEPGPRKPDQNRTLGDPEATASSRLNIRDRPEDKDSDINSAKKSAEYEHVQDDRETGHQAKDAATSEQAMRQIPPLEPLNPEDVEEEEEEDDDDDDDSVIALGSSSDEELHIADVKTAQVVGDRRKMGRSQQPANYEDEMQIEDTRKYIPTQTALQQRESSIHTQHMLWSSLTSSDVVQLRKEIEQKLIVLKRDPWSSEASVQLWHDIEVVVSPHVQELCEQLRLVLEPTKMSKMKGDYKTGKRLNMRKIIPYIASQFRKDKIWLRRTKPSQRQYQILLAVDDSYSMSDNHSKELAYESLALLGKALSFIEAGELSIVSFGEKVEVLHDFGESFNNNSGARILDSLTFAQNKTLIRQVVEHGTNVLGGMRGVQSKILAKEVAQLMIIISDGRGIFSEGEEAVRVAVRNARARDIFLVFLVLDSAGNKDSILDIQRSEFDKDGNLHLKSYMESFPFPFYVILRSIDALPLVLGEALRQWFELVTSTER